MVLTLAGRKGGNGLVWGNDVLIGPRGTVFVGSKYNGVFASLVLASDSALHWLHDRENIDELIFLYPGLWLNTERNSASDCQVWRMSDGMWCFPRAYWACVPVFEIIEEALYLKRASARHMTPMHESRMVESARTWLRNTLLDLDEGPLGKALRRVDRGWHAQAKVFLLKLAAQGDDLVRNAMETREYLRREWC